MRSPRTLLKRLVVITAVPLGMLLGWALAVLCAR